MKKLIYIVFLFPMLTIGQIVPFGFMEGSSNVTAAYIEAEDYDTLGSEWSDGGTDIVALTPTDTGAPVFSDSARRVEYTTPYLEAGDYIIWMSMTAGANNTVFIAMDQSDDTYLAVNNGTDYDWVTEYGSSTGNDMTNPEVELQFDGLSEGVHTIELYKRELTTVDTIYITKDGDTPTL